MEKQLTTQGEDGCCNQCGHPGQRLSDDLSFERHSEFLCTAAGGFKIYIFIAQPLEGTEIFKTSG